MNEVIALRVEDEDLENNWAWEIDCAADVMKRVARLECGKFSRFELYEELIELLALLEIYWMGQTPERQQETAKEVRELLRRFEALKTRMQDWAARELRHRIKNNNAEFNAALAAAGEFLDDR